MSLELVVSYLKQGYPQKTACGLARVSLDQFKEAFASDKEYQLDVLQAEAEAIQPQIDMLRQAAYEDYKAALEYLKKRDKENWADNQKIELSIEQGRNELWEEIKRRLPAELFREILTYLVND